MQLSAIAKTKPFYFLTLSFGQIYVHDHKKTCTSLRMDVPNHTHLLVRDVYQNTATFGGRIAFGASGSSPAASITPQQELPRDAPLLPSRSTDLVGGHNGN